MSRYIFFLIVMVFTFVGCSVKTNQPSTMQNSSTTIQDQKMQQAPKHNTESSVFSQSENASGTLPQDIPFVSKENYIAIVYPSAEINRYALEATNTINGYLLQVHNDMLFHLETFDIMRQSRSSIQSAMSSIVDQGISKVILMITKEYIGYLKEMQGLENLKIVLPLINKNEIVYDEALSKLDILFTGISYQDQFEKLSNYVKGYPLVEFYDNSSIGATLHTFASKHPIKYSRKIDDNNGRYKKVVKSIASRLNGSALILNTPIVKSSMLLSALTAEEVKPRVVVSTQLNFTPLVFSLTQDIDRRTLIIANSIGELPDMLEGYSELLGNNILYNWVNYSSMIAVEYLKTGNVGLFKDISIENGQVIYPVKLYKVRRNSFSLLPY